MLIFVFTQPLSQYGEALTLCIRCTSVDLQSCYPLVRDISKCLYTLLCILNVRRSVRETIWVCNWGEKLPKPFRFFRFFTVENRFTNLFPLVAARGGDAGEASPSF